MRNGASVWQLSSSRVGVSNPSFFIHDKRPGTNTNQTEPLELQNLRAQLKQEMAPYKIPTVLKLVDGIERNAMGKVNKKDIVKKHWPESA